MHGLDRRALAGWELLDGAPSGSRPGSPPRIPLGRPSGAWLAHLEALLERQRAALDPGRLRLAEVVEALDAWPEVSAEGDAAGPADAATAAYWWLKGAAVLAWSVMPRWALATWRRLGHEGNPSLPAFWQTPPLAVTRTRRRFEPLEVASVRQLTGVGAASG